MENIQITLDNTRAEEGLWHADNAPVFSRKKENLQKVGTAQDLKEGEMFYVELWGGDFAGRCFFMKAVQRRKGEGVVDCLWLSKRRRYFRDIVGRGIFSDIPFSTVVYKNKNSLKKRKLREIKKELCTPVKMPKRHGESLYEFPKIKALDPLSDEEKKKLTKEEVEFLEGLFD